MQELFSLTADDLARHTRAARRLTVALVHGAPEAEDIVQDAWLATLRSPAPVAPPGLGPWILGVARNLARMRARSAQRRRQRELRQFLEADTEAPSPEAALERAQLHKTIAGALLDLEEPFRSTVLLRYYEGLSAAEIARARKIPAGTVRWRLKEGLDRLRARLDADHGGDRMAWCVAFMPAARLRGEMLGHTLRWGAAAKWSLATGAVVALAMATSVMHPAHRAPVVTERPTIGAKREPTMVPLTQGQTTATASAPALALRGRIPAQKHPALAAASRAAEPRPVAETASQSPSPLAPNLTFDGATGSLRRVAGWTTALDEEEPVPPRDVTGEVLDAAGKPVAYVIVFAVDEGGSRVRGWARTREDGSFRLHLPWRRHDIGIMSPLYFLQSLQELDETRVRIRARPAFTGRDGGEALSRVKAWIPAFIRPLDQRDTSAGLVATGPSVGSVSGRVVDETGTPLAGVPVLGIHGRTKLPLAVGITDHEGRFVVVTRAGPARLAPLTPGLRVARARHQPSGEVELTLAIDTGPEVVTVSSGHTIEFRMTDSAWPAYLPPPEVSALLARDYGIDLGSPTRTFCPGDLRGRALNTSAGPTEGLVGISCPTPGSKSGACPPSVWQEQCRVPKFWWLRLMRHPPPSPAALGPGRWWEPMILEMQIAESQRAI